MFGAIIRQESSEHYIDKIGGGDVDRGAGSRSTFVTAKKQRELLSDV
jgi:hypothetical protein